MVDSKLAWTFTSACLYIIWAGNLNELASVVLGGPTLSLHTGLRSYIRTLERSDPYSTSAASKPQAWCFRVIFGSTSIFYSHFKKKIFFFFGKDLKNFWKKFLKIFLRVKIFGEKNFFLKTIYMDGTKSTTLNTLKTKSELNSFSPRFKFLRFFLALNTVILVEKSTFWHFDHERGFFESCFSMRWPN